MNSQTAAVRDRLEAFMPTVDDANPLPREAAEFVHGLLLASRARRAVEIGTSYGYSGLWMASALVENGGCLISIDQDVRKTESARARFEEAGLLEVVELRTGSALEVLPSLDGPFDFVLNDADKGNCRAYVELLTDKLSDRAILLTDNTRTHAAELADFLAWVRAHPGFHSSEIGVGNGMEFTVRRCARRGT